MDPETILKKYIEGEHSVEGGKVLATVSLVVANRNKELIDASTLLAKTTQASAELLATVTEESAEQLRKSNEIAVRSMQ